MSTSPNQTQLKRLDYIKAWKNAKPWVKIVLLITFFVILLNIIDFILGLFKVDTKVITITNKSIHYGLGRRSRSSFTLIDSNGIKHIYYTANIYKLIGHQTTKLQDYDLYKIGDRVKITYAKGIFFDNILHISKA